MDYDRLQELANKHIDIRAMLGCAPSSRPNTLPPRLLRWNGWATR